MAGDEDEPEQVVADASVRSSIAASRSGTAVLLRLELVAELLVLAIEPLAAAPVVDRPVLGRGHEPGARVARNARSRPLLERGDERVLRQVLGQADVARRSAPVRQ